MIVSHEPRQLWKASKGAWQVLRRSGARLSRRWLSSEMSSVPIWAFRFWLPSSGPSVTVPNSQLKSRVGRRHVRVPRGGLGLRVGLMGGGLDGSAAFATQIYGDQLSPYPVP